MTILRFIGFLFIPILAPVAIVGLAIAWIVLYAGIGLYQTWLRAKRDPRYKEYWWVGD